MVYAAMMVLGAGEVVVFPVLALLGRCAGIAALSLGMRGRLWGYWACCAVSQPGSPRCSPLWPVWAERLVFHSRWLPR
jgi:hypothetical protein